MNPRSSDNIENLKGEDFYVEHSTSDLIESREMEHPE